MLKKWMALTAALMLVWSMAAAEEKTWTDAQWAEMEQAVLAEGDQAEKLDTFPVTVDPNDLSVQEGLDESWMNILLMGTDTGSAQLNAGRTDSMILCSVNTVTGRVKLSTIARDLYVEIPLTGGHKNRINTANRFGGPYLAIKTVNETLKMNVTRYCSINFKGFSAIVDQLDGVDIQLTGGEAEEIGKSADYPARDQDGVAHLNGAQALAYCRIRNLDNNFGRSNRQRKFLEAMMDKVMRSNSLDGILGLVEKTMAYLDTNLSAGDVMALIFAVATQYQGLEMNSVPGNGEFTYQVIREMDVVVADAEKMTASLHSFIYEQ